MRPREKVTSENVLYAIWRMRKIMLERGMSKTLSSTKPEWFDGLSLELEALIENVYKRGKVMPYLKSERCTRNNVRQYFRWLTKLKKPIYVSRYRERALIVFNKKTGDFDKVAWAVLGSSLRGYDKDIINAKSRAKKITDAANEIRKKGNKFKSFSDAAIAELCLLHVANGKSELVRFLKWN